MNSTEIAAPVWSAVAATVSAASALLALRFGRANLHQSVRPELHLIGWSRHEIQRGDLTVDTIKIATINNLGRGAALRVYINIEDNLRNGRVPLAFMPTVRCPLVGTDGEEKLELEMSICWENVKQSKVGGKFISPSIVIYSWDTLDRRHKTTFRLFVVPLSVTNSLLSDQVADGVSLSMRSTVSRSVWLLKLQRALSRLPGLRRLAP